MGSPGNAPRPYRQRSASTLFLRVPSVDWARVRVGEKTEFRTLPHESSRLLKTYTPTPVVAYSRDGRGNYEQLLMVLEERRFEPVFNLATDPEGVRREGFESYDEWRRYWRKRRRGVFRPMERAYVWRVRFFDAEPDMLLMGELLMDRLYGDYL